MRRDRFLACCDKAWKKLLDFVARERASWRRYKLYGDRRWPNMDSWVQEYIQENSSIFTRWILEGYSGSSGDDELILLFTGTTRWSTQFACGIVTAFENQQTRVWELTRGKVSWLKRGSLAFFCFSASSPISGCILQETYPRQPSAFQLLCLLRCYHRSQVKLLTRRWVIWWDSRGLPSLLTLGGWQDWSTFVLALGLRTNSYKLKSPPSPLS